MARASTIGQPHPPVASCTTPSRNGPVAATTYAMESMLDLCALLADDERNDIRIEAALIKLFGSEMAWKVADDLVPNDHPIGTKRICTDTNYYETFNRDHVTLVNLRRDPIEAVEATGVRTASTM